MTDGKILNWLNSTSYGHIVTDIYVIFSVIMIFGLLIVLSSFNKKNKNLKGYYDSLFESNKEVKLDLEATQNALSSIKTEIGNYEHQAVVNDELLKKQMDQIDDLEIQGYLYSSLLEELGYSDELEAAKDLKVVLDSKSSNTVDLKYKKASTRALAITIAKQTVSVVDDELSSELETKINEEEGIDIKDTE